MEPSWPDLGTPPAAWTVLRQGSSLHLLPPGVRAGARPPAVIVVSPLVPVSAQMPAPLAILQQTLAAEASSFGTVVLSQGEPVALRTEAGLEGVRLDVVVRTTRGEEQLRTYGMWKDATWLYGLHYLADAAVHATWLPTWEAAAVSLRPSP